MSEQNKLEEVIRTSLESIRAMVDANTVVGTPIQTPSGTTIIPISKVSVGYASGGLDFGSKTSAAKNFGGGGGTGLSIQPVCFLSVDANGRTEVLTIEKETPDTIERVAEIVERTPDLLARLKAVFKKARNGKDDETLEDLAKAAAEAAEEVAEAIDETEEA